MNYFEEAVGIPLLEVAEVPFVAEGISLVGPFINSVNLTFSFAAKLSS
jgi:hypothetical protein